MNKSEQIAMLITMLYPVFAVVALIALNESGIAKINYGVGLIIIIFPTMLSILILSIGAGLRGK